MDNVLLHRFLIYMLIQCVLPLDYSIKWPITVHSHTQSSISPHHFWTFSSKATKYQGEKRKHKSVHIKRMTESLPHPEAMVSFKKCGKRFLWKWKVRRSCCDLCADQAGRGGPVYFCWLDCNRGQQLLPLDTGPPHSERDLSECMHAHCTQVGFILLTGKKRHQLVKSPLTMPFVWGLHKMKQTSRWGELLCAKKAESRQNFRWGYRDSRKALFFNRLQLAQVRLTQIKITWKGSQSNKSNYV